MKHYDWNNPDDRRLAYRESMLGINRPQNASKKAARMVDGLIQACNNYGRYDALAIGKDDNAKSASHWLAVNKDRRKALLRYIGRMEYESEETALMEEIIQHAVEHCTPNDGEAQIRLDNLLRDLKNVRQKIADRKEG